MAEVTYYFNAYVTPVWANPDNLIDGDIGTFGYTNVKKTAQILTGNTCPGTGPESILKVEIRVFAYGDGDDRIDITPVFPGGNGDVHPTTPVVSPGDWTPYVDITYDTNHPDWSSYSHVQNLDCIIDSVPVAKGNTLYCAKVEVRVTTWIPPDIDVGAFAIDRNSSRGSGYTRVDKNNPANTSGTLHTVKIYVGAISISGLIVGTFYLTNGNILKCRDSVFIGDAEVGAERTFTDLSIEVQEGDYIGAYWTSGSIEYSTSGFDGIWSLIGEHIDPNDEADYGVLDEGTAISLYGYGDIEEWVPPVSDIDVGADPIDRAYTATEFYTYVDKNNPANASGTLHTVQVYAAVNMTGLIVGTFYATNGNTLKCRDSEAIGAVEAGAWRTFTDLSITIVAGDYIGCYFGSGEIELDIVGFDGVWWAGDEFIDPGDEVEYVLDAGYAISLYGYGDIEAPPVGQPYIKRVQAIAGMRTIGVNQIG